MSTDITQLLSPTLLYMLFCYFVTLFIRKGLELWKPRLKDNTEWRDFLPVLPVVIGIAFAYVPKYPIPAVFIASWASKGMWGFVTGALSTWAFAILQAVFKRMFGVDIGTWNKSIRPGPVPGTLPIDVPPSTTLRMDVEKK
jgi:hypothetical protein